MSAAATVVSFTKADDRNPVSTSYTHRGVASARRGRGRQRRLAGWEGHIHGRVKDASVCDPGIADESNRTHGGRSAEECTPVVVIVIGAARRAGRWKEDSGFGKKILAPKNDTPVWTDLVDLSTMARPHSG